MSAEVTPGSRVVSRYLEAAGLQVMQSDYYSLAAERNHTRNVPVLAPRGKMKQAMAALGGRGGGTRDMAQGGAHAGADLDAALTQAAAKL